VNTGHHTPLKGSVSVGKDTVSDEGTIVIISRTAILLGEEGKPIVKLPAREQLVKSGVGAEHKRSGTNDLYILPLVKAMKVTGSSEAIVVADATTPYRLLVEVLYSLGQAGIGRYHLMVMKKSDPTIKPWTEPEPQAVPRKPSLPAIRGKTPLGLTVAISPTGIDLNTKAGSLATGCQKLGPSLTVPKRGNDYDYRALLSCLVHVKSEYPKETRATITATAEIEHRYVIRVVALLTGTKSQPLFSATSFKAPSSKPGDKSGATKTGRAVPIPGPTF